MIQPIAKPTPRVKVRKPLKGRLCRACGVEFKPRNSKIRFCTQPCWMEWERARWSEKRGPCERCGQPIPNRHHKRFCSLACWYAMNTKPKQMALGLPKRNPPRRKCIGCGIEFQAPPSLWRLGRRYCSRDCYNANDPSRQAVYLEANCRECGVPFKRRPANMNQNVLKFCSLRCSRAFFQGERSPAWRGGSNPNRGAGWLKRAEEARERDGRCCRRCGKTEADNGERLSVDHLLPWRSFDSAEEANRLDNLVSLCRGCHAIKTQVAERKWLKGDALAMQRHIEAVTLPSAAR